MTSSESPSIDSLRERGVEIAGDVQPDRIAPDTVIHTGCRIRGAATSIGPGCVLGAEGPATVENCQLGANVKLQGGYFSGSVFLDGSSVGASSHVRPGTLLEEQANAAHAVGFKQTVLLPFVTAGSLINFCDALMSGGTSRKNHSEIGSSYIHFNFTPHGDKATPSLCGDVPRGVMLDQPPIFLGGQGGLVGPVRLEYGTVIPAGTVHRRDVLDPGLLVLEGQAPRVERKNQSYAMGLYRSVGRLVFNNLAYIGNLRALQAWYAHVRQPLMKSDPFSAACYEGALRCLATILDERVSRLGQLAGKMEASIRLAGDAGVEPRAIDGQRALLEGWPGMESALKEGPGDAAGAGDRDRFLKHWNTAVGNSSYIETVQVLSPDAKAAGTAWLQQVVDSVTALWTNG